MSVSDVISKETMDWNVDILEDFVSPEDISLIKSLHVSQTFNMDEFCWHFTKTGFYTVKSGYWMAKNILTPLDEKGCTEPSIQALQAQSWNVQAPH